MIEVHAEFPQREVIQANAVVDNEEKTVSEVIISAKPEITGVTASVDDNVGTPYVEVTPTGTGTDYSFDLAFHNLKGDSFTTYEFVQAVASSTWVITHNLDKYPSVFAVDSSGSVQIPNDITYDSKNQITVEFLSEFSGKAYLN